jgi:peptide chain release factor 1
MKVHVEAVKRRLSELEEQLGRESFLQDRERFKACSQEHAYLSDILHLCEREEKAEKELKENEDLLRQEKDPDFLQVIQEEVSSLQREIEALQAKLKNLLIPPNEEDDRPCIVELRAGAGGQEAALFVADCVRMYQMYAANIGWKLEQLSSTPSDLGGFKEFIMAVSGKSAWRFLQHEAGTHRVQRVPETEAQGRIHTSTITIAVLQDVEEDANDVHISETDLRIETTRSSGAGGQHVNKTDSAVRITHIPTGVVVFCQEERSQHKNKDKAMRYLRAKVREIEVRRRKSEEDAKRLEQVGSGDRSEKIRTYNFPQNRITDHRINLTRYDLDRVMNGDLEDFSQALVQWAYSTSQKGQASPWILET